MFKSSARGRLLHWTLSTAWESGDLTMSYRDRETAPGLQRTSGSSQPSVTLAPQGPDASSLEKHLHSHAHQDRQTEGCTHTCEHTHTIINNKSFKCIFLSVHCCFVRHPEVKSQTAGSCCGDAGNETRAVRKSSQFY